MQDIWPQMASDRRKQAGKHRDVLHNRESPANREGCRMRRRSTRLVAAALSAVVALSLVACTPGDPTVPSPAGSRDVGIQLFQWNWNSIAAECTDVLGPAGISWVLTSPPQEHILGEQWWTAYQPVSYKIESRLGTREQFDRDDRDLCTMPASRSSPTRSSTT